MGKAKLPLLWRNSTARIQMARMRLSSGFPYEISLTRSISCSSACSFSGRSKRITAAISPFTSIDQPPSASTASNLVAIEHPLQLQKIPLTEYSVRVYIPSMVWDVEYTDEFGQWWAELSQDEQESVAASVRLLEERGPTLGFPNSSGIHGSKHGHMRELRTQHDGHPLRTLYAFDPRRSAILLVGGDKTGDERWYETHVPIADRLYDEHLEQLRKEGLING